MPKIESIVIAQTANAPTSELSVLTRTELEDQLEKSRRHQLLLDSIEQAASIGHYEWNYELDRLESCSEVYARLFNMTIEEVLKAQDSREKSLRYIHPDDHESYRFSGKVLRDSGSTNVDYRILLDDGRIKYVREFGILAVDDDGVGRGSFGLLHDISEQVKYERDLEYRDELARQTESITDVGHFIYDEANERYVYMSDGCARIFGSTAEAYMAKVGSSETDLSDIVEEDRERVRQEYAHYIETGLDCALEYRILRTDGKVRWVRELTTAKLVKKGRVSQTLGVVQDITARVYREQELMLKDALANQAEEITDIGHFIYDEINEKYIFVSPGLANIYGREVEEIMTNMVSDAVITGLVHDDDIEPLQKVYDRFIAEGGEWRVEYRLIRADGEVRWVRELGKTYLLTHGIPEQTIGVIQDITAQKQAEQEIIKARDTLEQQVVARTRELGNTVKQLKVEIEEREKIAAELDFLANHDALTGLPSLRLCKDRLNQSLAEARRKRQASAVMFLDLDGFKEINDQHGHEFGDLVLTIIAERIQGAIRETDTVARIGGDEFVIILSSLPEKGIANRIAISVLEQIARPAKIENIEVKVSTSIGISFYPEHGTTAEELIRSADNAMYLIKRSGKNNFGFVQSDTIV
jgi:diguanylate cyclase (GGDEF)-like protein/PAS domain S-box-containing protein